MADAFCRWCGTAGCDAGCRRELDPPRYCPTCGKRLRVLVTPRRAEATCRTHGVVAAP